MEHLSLRNVVVGSALFALLMGCSSSTSSSGPAADGGTGDACGLGPNAKVSAVTKKSSDANCPSISAADINNAPPDDAGSTCTPKIDSAACSATLDCTTTDASGTITVIKGGATKSGTTASGDITVTVTPSGGQALTCTYNIVYGG